LKSITLSPGNKHVEFVLLPPVGARIPGAFQAVERNDQLHALLLASAQRFRGEIYLQDGAVGPHQLTPDGRHHLPVDELSWHLLTLDENGETCACLRLHQEPSPRSFDKLPVSRSALTQCPTWGNKLGQAVESEVTAASKQHLLFGDVGGWAIAHSRRRTLEPLRVILAGYSLMQLLGGVLGIATATCKHGSAQILRRLGLQPLHAEGETIPSYYDPHFNSEMEVLSFDSRRPNPKYREWVAELTAHLIHAPVIWAQRLPEAPVFPRIPAVHLWNQAQSQVAFGRAPA